MKTKMFLIVICALLSAGASAEIISVTVKDRKTKESLEFATVELLNEKDSVIAGGITDSKGYINLPGTVNNGKMRIQFIGYKTYETPVSNKDLGTVFLEEDTQLLAEVAIVGQSRATKVDRDVTVITKELKAGAATSRELLGKLNNVQYNPYDQSISVNGNTNVLILIDGIEKDQQMAKTLSPERIARVEVIKDPVGKYAADGYTAVINIITKKDYSGFDVTINTNPMFNFIDQHGNPSPLVQENSGMNILYTYKKLNLYANYSGNYGKFGLPTESETKYGDLLVMSPPIDNKHPNLNILNNSNSVSFGGDYLLKPDNTIALELNYTGFNNKTTIITDLTTYLNNAVIGESKSINNMRNTGDALQATLTYHGKWSEKSRFEGDFRYRHSTPTNHSDFTQGAIFSDSKNSQTENFYRLNLNYTYQFTPAFSMEIAYGLMINRYNLYQNNMTLTQNQTRNRPSFYISYNPVKQLSIKVGTMVEFFNQTFMNLEQSQTGLLPFANIMYKPSNKFSVTAKYRAYPRYPDIGQLSTFTTQVDTLTWSVGNPELKPSNYQEIGLDFNILNKFTISPVYSFDSHNYQQYLWEENGKYYQSQVNANYKSLGVNVSFRLPITKTLFWQNWSQLRDTWLSYNGIDNNRTTFLLNSTLVYSMPKWNAVAGVGIQKMVTKYATLQGYNTGGNDIPMLMLQKSFFKNKLNCTFVFVPPIKEGWLKYSQENLTQIPGYYSINSAGLGLLQNMMLLQINYHFNSGKQIKVKKSSLDNDSNTQQKSGGLGL